MKLSEAYRLQLSMDFSKRVKLALPSEGKEDSASPCAEGAAHFPAFPSPLAHHLHPWEFSEAGVTSKLHSASSAYLPVKKVLSALQ